MTLDCRATLCCSKPAPVFHQTKEMSNELLEAKQVLVDKLGPNYTTYIHLLGQWFRGFISKEEFDEKARQLVDQNLVVEHNKFWLAFFHHCANNTTSSLQTRNLRLNDSINKSTNQKTSSGCQNSNLHFQSRNLLEGNKLNPASRIKCLPNRLLAQMRIFVIAWEMGLNSVNDKVGFFIDLALQQFLKNIITEMICTKTAYRVRENRFKHGFGVNPINPYLNNSMKVYSANLEYDPYQIEANKMNSSLVDTYAYNDSLFPSRLHESQALYEYACSTTSISSSFSPPKKLKLSQIFSINDNKLKCMNRKDLSTSEKTNGACKASNVSSDEFTQKEVRENCNGLNYLNALSDETSSRRGPKSNQCRKLTLFHLLIAMLTNKSIIPSQSLHSLSLERIVTKLPY